MEYLYKYSRMPLNCEDIINTTNAATQIVYDKITNGGVNGPHMDNHYRKRFYEVHLKNLKSKLINSAYHVMWAIALSKKKPSEICLVDHGGGLGFTSLLAKEIGVGRVIYNDIDAKFVEAAQGIAQMAGAFADQYITGDVDILVKTLGNDGIDALVSYDVLEHIYNLDDFFNILCGSICCPKVLFMSSGANMFSPRYVHQVIPIQRGNELLNCCSRVAIIREYAPHLKAEQIMVLCKKTRMLVRSEIETLIKRYLESGHIELPKITGANAYDPFGTNTVDPETGWWAEHLLNPFYLSKQLRKYGFAANVRPGYYGNRGSFLNFVIRYTGVAALPLAAFYTICAQKTDSALTSEHT